MLIIACFGLAPVNAGPGPTDYLKRSRDWFGSDEAARLAENIISHQSPLGGWPKNTNTAAGRFTGAARSIAPTFDNGATTGEMRFLARTYEATGKSAYRESFLLGYDYILKAQYRNGGWPQSYPPGKGYPRHITFNDDAMVRLMEFLRESYSSPVYKVLDEQRKLQARQAFEKGIECILRCQIRTGGKLTAWCAQHDEVDFSPRPARTYELASLSGAESVKIVRLLMSLENPSPEVTRSIEAAVAWFRAAALRGVKVVKVPDAKAPRGTDKRVVADPEAPPIWGRFYEIGTNEPIFCDRDGVPKKQLSEIGYERRNGYNWLDDWPRPLIEKEYPEWLKKHARPGEQ